LESVAPVRLPASFRDPSGFVYERDGVLLRQVNSCYAEELELLLGSGLHDELTGAGLLLPHEIVSSELAADAGAYRVLRPEPVPHISYPYEWSFSQLRDAALLTLEIQTRALDRGMTLKDASAFNVQFLRGRPVFIDTLSFERYAAGTPWVAYRQFCQHFLAPLLLMSRLDVRLGHLLRTYLDGVPVDLASRLLPRRTWARWGVALHIHLHARSLARHAGTKLSEAGTQHVGETAMRGLVDSLQSTVRGLRWHAVGTAWAEYEVSNSYSRESHEAKVRLVREYLGAIPGGAGTVWDLGANTGVFSRVAALSADRVVAFDIDPAAVERNYLRERDGGDGRILPLLLDLMNPTPGLGWAGVEREPWHERGRPDAVMALALVHHLAIAGNVPLVDIARLFAGLARWLVIEFVPRSDSQVQRLLGSRRDIFPRYDEAGFEAEFGRGFRVLRTEQLPGSERRLYLMERRS
jgi:hypothetical protein